jgi:molybdopterin converting factor subunit 1
VLSPATVVLDSSGIGHARSELTDGADSSVLVLYFAALRDLAGTSEEQVGIPEPTSVAALLAMLEARHGQLQGRLGSVRVAVNEEFSEPSTVLRGGEVVALIPPVSGG